MIIQSACPQINPFVAGMSSTHHGSDQWEWAELDIEWGLSVDVGVAAQPAAPTGDITHAYSVQPYILTEWEWTELDIERSFDMVHPPSPIGCSYEG